jgi:choline transport protein
LSYISGWLCVLGWQVNIAGGCYLVTLQIQGIIALNDSSYSPKPWHGTLMIIAIATVAIMFNTFLAKKLPLIEGLMLAIHVFGFFAVLIPLWILSPIQPAKEVFTEFTDVYGWPSQGLACLVGIVGPMYSLLGPDSAVHMGESTFNRFPPQDSDRNPAEEIRDASRVLPLGMILTLIVNGTTGFIMVITFAFCLPDRLVTATPLYFFTYIDVFYNSTNNKAAASILTALITTLVLCSTISAVATSSRQMFAFARDRGLPFSSFLCKVRSTESERVKQLTGARRYDLAGTFLSTP